MVSSQCGGIRGPEVSVFGDYPPPSAKLYATWSWDVVYRMSQAIMLDFSEPSAGRAKTLWKDRQAHAYCVNPSLSGSTVAFPRWEISVNNL